jgi:hypothetical protein
MMVRFIHASLTGSMRGLGNFRLIGTQEQAEAALELHSLLIKTEGPLELNALHPIQHRLCDALLRTENLSDDPIACPTDQMIFIASLLGRNRYRTANSIISICAQLQFCFRSILIHVVRLKADGTDQYSPFSSAPLSQDGMDGCPETSPKPASEEYTETSIFEREWLLDSDCSEKFSAPNHR